MSSLTDLEGPAMTPPPGVTPDFVHSGERHALGIGIATLGVFIATFSVVVRLASKLPSRQFGWADAFTVAAWAQFIAFQAILYKCSVFPGITRHQWNLQLKDLAYFNYNVFVETVLYGTCMMCLKLAILIDWYQIFVLPGQRDAFFWCIHVLIWSNVIFYMVGLFADVFQCIPAQKIWDPLYEGGVCNIDIAANNFSVVLINIASDLAIFILPQWRIWRLNLSPQRKIGVSLVFAAGVLVTVLGAIRLVCLIPLISSDDSTFWLSLLGLYSGSEMAVGFLIVGLPCLPKVYNSLPFSDSLKNLLRSFRDSSTRRINSFSPEVSWRRTPSRKRRGLWDITELEETELRTQGAVTVNRDEGQSSAPPFEEQRQSNSVTELDAHDSFPRRATTDIV